MEMTATSILSLFQTSKDQRVSFVENVINDISEGNKNAMDIHLQIKCMEDMATQLKDDPRYRSYLLDEVKKYRGGAKSVEYHNAKFEEKETGTKYDFSQCGDPIQVELAAAAEKAKKALKEREDFLKKLPDEGMSIVDEETSEVCKIFKPSKTSTTSVAVTLR
jgi:hypothetical protein